MAKETSQTLDRGLRVLSVLADSPEGLTVTEVAAALGVSRTVVYRLIVTLEQHGLVRRGTDARCRLGLAVLTLARQVQPLLRDAAMPVLRRLAEGAGATAYLGVVDGHDLFAVAVAEPPRSDVHIAYRLGSRIPLEMGAAGRAVLAARTAAGRPLDPPWVVASGDSPGSSGIAAPVLGIPGIEAAVGVAAAAPVEDIGPRVARAAQDIARLLG
ncbi:MAG: helix-turn-helix domain-containing protein [Actinobacteria bacterium]|nr:helix-turn-helix domain-containing protein [Actinomycetota bacterium]